MHTNRDSTTIYFVNLDHILFGLKIVKNVYVGCNKCPARKVLPGYTMSQTTYCMIARKLN